MIYKVRIRSTYNTIWRIISFFSYQNNRARLPADRPACATLSTCLRRERDRQAADRPACASMADRDGVFLKALYNVVHEGSYISRWHRYAVAAGNSGDTE